MTKHRTNPIRTLAATLAATALVGGAAFGQQAEEDGAAAGSADPAAATTAQAEADAGATATFYSDLPGDGGEALGEAPLGSAAASVNGVENARYVVVDHADRTLAFPVESVNEDGVRVGVDTPADGESLDGDATLSEVGETLRPVLEGNGEVVATAREEGEAQVVTQIAPREELRPASPVEVGENTQVIAFDDGETETLDVRNADAATYGELEVSTGEDVANVLDDAVWENEGGVPAAGTADDDGMDGAQDGTAQDGASSSDDATTAPDAAGQEDSATGDSDGAAESTTDAADGATADDAGSTARNEGAANDGDENAAGEDAED